MSKIKFRLEVWKTSVVFQVLEMDERFRYAADKDGPDGLNRFESANGFSVSSQLSTCLFVNSVYLRGEDRSLDDLVRCILLSSHEEAEAYYSNVLYALRDWAENWEGWRDGEENEHDDDMPNVFEF